ncbi:MAG: hypothetical protein Ct9H300mP14_14320 [Gammaproteobacteria bacterium]|nr:MAG: hypothetical protein Ct9H300mP14_14320 [Gammaproteobacteria bacterium]
MTTLKHYGGHWQISIKTSQTKIFKHQGETGQRAIVDESVPVDEVEIFHEADLMYRGQSHVFRVAVQSPGFSSDAVAESFADRYRERFDIILEDMTPVLASLRTTVIGRRHDLTHSLFSTSNPTINAKPHRPEWSISTASGLHQLSTIVRGSAVARS